MTAFSLFFAAAGAFTMAAQALLFREYLVLHRGGELAIGLFFGSWLAWVAIGATAARVLLRRRRPGPRLLPGLMLLWAAAPALQVWLLGSIRSWSGVAAWEALPLDDLLLFTTLSNAPVSLLTGLLFPLGCALLARPERRAPVSAAWIWECAGAFAGGGLVTLGIALGVPGEHLLVATAALLVGAAAALALSLRARLQAAGLALLLLLGLGGATSGGLHTLRLGADRARWSALLPSADLLGATETPYGRVAVGRRVQDADTQVLVVENGALSAAYPDRAAAAEEAAILLSQRPGAMRVLLLSGRPESLLAALLTYPVARIDLFEPDPAAAAFVAPFLPNPERSARSDPRVRVSHEEVRAALARPGDPYDLIAVMTGDPPTAHANRLFTRDFFEAARRHLAPGGVLVTRITGEAAYAGETGRRYEATLFATLRSVFREVGITPGQSRWFFASVAPGQTSIRGEVLAERLAAIPRKPDPTSGVGVFHPDRLREIWSAEGAVALAEDYAKSARTSAEDLNTDARPRTYFHALRAAARRTAPGLARALGTLRAAGVWLFVIPLALVALLLLLRPRGGGEHEEQRGPGGGEASKGSLLVGLSGAVGMSGHVLLLHAFQSRFGALFLDIGWVNALFMLGLFAGGALLRRASVRVPGRHALRARGLLAVQAAALLALPTLLAALPTLPEGVTRSFFFGLFILLGGLAGAAFPLAEAFGPSAARLESADHWGGALGAALAGTLMIPVLGLGATCLVLALALLLLLPSLEGPTAARARARPLPPSFPWPRLSATLLVSGLAVVALSAVVRARTAAPLTRLDPGRLAALLGESASAFEERNKPFPHHVAAPVAPASAAPGRPARVALASAAVVPEAQGYGGPINLLLDLDGDGRLRRLRVLAHQESPSYVEGLGVWLRSFEGRPLRPDLVLRKPEQSSSRKPYEIDVLSGATVTAEAVVRTVNRSRRIVARDLLGIEAGPGSETSVARGFLRPGPTYLLLALVLGVLLQRRSGPRLRTAFLLANLGVGGLWLKVQLSTVDVARLARLNPPGIDTPEIWLMGFGVLLLSLLFGQLYCGYLCPFGAAQELLSKLGLARRPGPRLDRALRFLKFLLLWALVVAYLLGAGRAVFDFDPLQRVWRGRAGGALALGSLVLIAGLSLLVVRPWCRYLCPTGAFLALGNKLRLAERYPRLSRPKRYGRCDLGVQHHRDLDCLQCDRCVHGETVAPAAGARGRWRDPLLLAGAAGMLALILASMPLGLGSSAERAAGGGKARDLPVEQLLRRIDQGKLSRHPARHYRLISPPGCRDCGAEAPEP